MAKPISIKICGITEPDALEASIEAGADFAGLVFYPRSPRAVSLDQAGTLAAIADKRIKLVGLFVDPTLDEVSQVLERVSLDFLQLHGDESAYFIKDLKKKTGLPVIKAIPVAGPEDLVRAYYYQEYADWLLFDAKTPADAIDTLPGGRGEVFDWSILHDFASPLPWMLAGGLNSENIREAVIVTHPDAVDVSSGVENQPGDKSADKIRTFIEAVRGSS